MKIEPGNFRVQTHLFFRSSIICLILATSPGIIISSLNSRRTLAETLARTPDHMKHGVDRVSSF